MVLFKLTPEGKKAARRKSEFAEKEWCCRAEVVIERGLTGPEFDGYAVRMYNNGIEGEYFAGDPCQPVVTRPIRPSYRPRGGGYDHQARGTTLFRWLRVRNGMRQPTLKAEFHLVSEIVRRSRARAVEIYPCGLLFGSRYRPRYETTAMMRVIYRRHPFRKTCFLYKPWGVPRVPRWGRWA